MLSIYENGNILVYRTQVELTENTRLLLDFDENSMIEASFGFDTVCKVYSKLIGNIQHNANSAKKYCAVDRKSVV